MTRMLTLLFLVLVTSSATAAVTCSGTVSAVYKWNTMTSLSVQIALGNGTVLPWINLPTKSDEAMALLALASGKPVDLYWNAADIAVCANGWEHNRVLNGFFVVRNQ